MLKWNTFLIFTEKMSSEPTAKLLQCGRSLRNELNHDDIVLLKPIKLSFLIRISWLTLSKAFLTSVYITSTQSRFSTLQTRSESEINRLIIVDLILR